ncbi:MAG: phosphoadenosine phosphosulfate reductase family protein [Prolixibacteraceae bacterium]|nr:phosphoadenosine phosphosulfate reductase family protein [Prolixibacteraceae bacterium]
MFRVVWDKDINGVLLTTNGNGEALNVSPRPVFHEELTLLGFDKIWNWRYHESNDPLLWALDRRYYYKGELVAEVKGGNIFDDPKIEITEAGKELKLKPINIQKVVEKNQKLLFLIEQEAIEFIEQTYRTYSLKKIRRKAKANEEVDWALLAEMHEKNTKIKHAVVKQDCDSFDIMPLDLAKENNKTVYLNTKIDQFIASFSGGKDSQVTLDLVSRVIPPDDFMVIYSDTGMEIPPSLEIWEKTKKYYTANYPQLRFHLAQNPQKDTVELWEKFGLPSRIHRWCCTVVKTAPLYRDLKHLNGNGKQPNVLVFEGVRAEESSKREAYDRIGKQVKHNNVINARPIFSWSLTEIFLYLFSRNLAINQGYRYGLSRVGCIICPFSSDWNERIARKVYPEKMEPFLNVIKKATIESGVIDVQDYIKESRWKRRSGSKSNYSGVSRIDIIDQSNDLKVLLTNPKEDILEWLKVLGPLFFDKSNKIIKGEIKFKEIACAFTIETLIDHDNKTILTFENIGSYPTLLGNVKKVINKATYCNHCLACEVECPTGALVVEPRVKIDSTKCIHCGKCIDFIEKGCMMAKSLNILEGGKNMTTKITSIDRYNRFGLRDKWLNQYFINPNNYFHGENDLGIKMVPAFLNWLKDSEILNNSDKRISDIGMMLQKQYKNSNDLAWEIIWINLIYNSTIVKWYSRDIEWNSALNREDLESILKNSFPDIKDSTKLNGLASLINMFVETPLGSKFKFWEIQKRNSKTIIRKAPFENVSSISVAYSIYRYANDKNRYNLTVSELYAPEQKQGIYKEFGVSKERFQNILRTLQENINGIVKVDLVMGLDNISLREDLTYTEVLKLLLEK